jgi:hypothetical protein
MARSTAIKHIASHSNRDGGKVESHMCIIPSGQRTRGYIMMFGGANDSVYYGKGEYNMWKAIDWMFVTMATYESTSGALAANYKI